MKRKDILEFIPIIHEMNPKKMKKIGQKGFSKYQILKSCDLRTNQNNYNKIDECIVMGFLIEVNDNPPEFIPDKNKIWSFWKKTPTGIICKNMIKNHLALFE